MDKSKHTSVNFCGLEKVRKYVNNPFFRGLEEMDNETFEVPYENIIKFETFFDRFFFVQIYNFVIKLEIFQVTMQKKKVVYDLPLQMGVFVYQYAKLKMLEFMYDVIDKHLDRTKYCLLEMDTG